MDFTFFRAYNSPKLVPCYKTQLNRKRMTQKNDKEKSNPKTTSTWKNS